MKIVPENNKLTNLQQELLKTFSYNVPDEQLLEIRAILSNYFAGKASAEMNKLWVANEWSDETMEQWLTEHERVPYKK
jgi:hypothetical protein